jgi:hypothetical protein
MLKYYYVNYIININIKIIMFLGSKARLVRKADNLTAIYEPIVYTMWGS